MIDRRKFTTLLGGAVVAPELLLRPSWAEAAKSRTVLYSAVGPDLTLYGMGVGDATLVKQDTVTLPANIQYAWPHPSKRYLYVASSNRTARFVGDKNFAHAFRIDAATGALAPHGEPQSLPSRPVHTSVDMAGEYLLTAYNGPSNVTVHRINRDGTLGDAVS